MRVGKYLMNTKTKDTEQIWSCLEKVHDPEIPAISVVDLGIVRKLTWDRSGETLQVTITPTYSGCPANDVIAHDIESALRDYGIKHLEIKRQLSPPWTTDWMSERGKKNLHAYGIAPPAQSSAQQKLNLLDKSQQPTVACPRCASKHTVMLSYFGSTPCKAQYRCETCLEPFDYFKCL